MSAGVSRLFSRRFLGRASPHTALSPFSVFGGDITGNPIGQRRSQFQDGEYTAAPVLGTVSQAHRAASSAAPVAFSHSLGQRRSHLQDGEHQAAPVLDSVSLARYATSSAPVAFSHLPESTVYGGPVAQSPWKRVTLHHLAQKYARKEPISMVTAYDYPSAVHVDAAGIDILLVGDSVGMVVHGHDTTLPVTLAEMLVHCQAVSRGAARALLVGDLPFGSYEQSTAQAVASATQLLKHGGMDAVKLEGGGVARVAAARAIAEAGIAVMGHVGLTPQAISVLGGFRPQGRRAEGAVKVVEHALALEEAGCFALVLECVPSPVAAAVTAALSIPTIGIGAGPHCSGQVLVYHDLLGMMQHPHYVKVTPKFCKQYANLGSIITEALTSYKEDVEAARFPSAAHTPYRIERADAERFLEELHRRGLARSAEAAAIAADADALAGEPQMKTPPD